MYLHYWDLLDLPSDAKARLWRPGFCVCVLQLGHRLAGQLAVPLPPPGSSQRTASPATAQRITIRITFIIHFKQPAKLQIRCWCLNSAVNFVTDHSFIIVISLWVDTHNHPDFAFSIEVVFKQMCNFRVPVRHHLEENKASVKRFPNLKLFMINQSNSSLFWQDCEIPTLLVPHIWFSRSTSMHVRSVIRDWLIFPVNKTLLELFGMWSNIIINNDTLILYSTFQNTRRCFIKKWNAVNICRYTEMVNWRRTE